MANTYNEILTRALARVPDSFDKREGSVIYDALAPAAYELSLAYEEMEKLYNDTFAGTADRAGLVSRAAEYDISPNPATASVRRGIFTPTSVDVPIGERFNLGEINFVVTEKEAAGKYLLSCETPGAAGNLTSGSLLPIGYVSGLETANLTDVVVYGEEEEDTEAFRERFLAVLRGDTKDGNVAQYKAWAAAYPGIGAVKVLSLWNGSNTVKVSILNSENLPASSTLVADFQAFLDPGSQGLGNGAAPIGAIVTVSTASTVALKLTGSVTLAAGYSGLGDDVRAAVVAYLKGIAYKKSVVPYMGLGAAVQNCACIDSLTNFRVNNGVADVSLQTEQIGVLSQLTLEVV